MSPLPVGAAAELATAHEPAWVRKGSARVQQDYRVALAFEQALVEQLTRAMSEAGGAGEGGQEGDGGEAGSGGGGVPGPIASLLPQALAGGIVGNGGLGLAAEFTRAQEGLHGPGAAAGAGASAPTAGGRAPAAPGGGTTAPAPGGGTAAPEAGAGR